MTVSVFARVNPCTNPGLSCVDAVKNNCLTGSITGGNALVTNNAAASYDVGLAIYQVFDAADHDSTLEHQVLFDSDTGTVSPGHNLNLAVDLPGCQYQIDLFCGPVITSFAGGVRYNDRKLDYAHKTTGQFCVQQFCGDGIKNGAEECDGTNGVGEHQICNSDCILGTLPYCGDSITNLLEQCDAGSNNSVECTPACDGSCDYCNSDCTTQTSYGGSCGGGCVGSGCGGGGDGVPVFPGITIGFAVIGVGLGLVLLRKQH